MIALAASGVGDPSTMVEASRESIGVAAGVRCPKASSDEIVVCGRSPAHEAERYRLPLPTTPEPGRPGHEAVFEERNRWLDIGKSGIGSETTVGPGGATGHNLNALKQRMDRNEGHPIRF